MRAVAVKAGRRPPAGLSLDGDGFTPTAQWHRTSARRSRLPSASVVVLPARSGPEERRSD
jgi:hypothetical protein